jgi:hypothetical protein
MKLIYEAGWNTYEEWGAIEIYVDEDYFDIYYVKHGGRSVYSSMEDPDWEEPYLANEYEVSVLKEKWDLIEKENEEYWNRNGGF